MSTNTAKAQGVSDWAALFDTQYGCGPVHFAGTDEALYERHLLFDSGVDLSDRTIAEYAAEIWNVQPCPVPDKA